MNRVTLNNLQKKFGFLLREWLGDRCPVCHEPLVGHQYALLGLVVSESKAQEPFIQAFREHRWSDIRMKEFNPSLDALRGNVLRCPSGRLAWFITFEPYDMFTKPYYVAEIEVVDEHESNRLEAAIQWDEWQRFPEGWLINRRILALKLLRVRRKALKKLQALFHLNVLF